MSFFADRLALAASLRTRVGGTLADRLALTNRILSSILLSNRLVLKKRFGQTLADRLAAVAQFRKKLLTMDPYFYNLNGRRLKRTLSVRTVSYPPSYFTGRLSRFARAHQGVARARATAGFLDACRRYHLLPWYVPIRRPYRACHVTRLAKRAGELFIQEKVRSAHRRLLAKRLATSVENLRSRDNAKQSSAPNNKIVDQKKEQQVDDKEQVSGKGAGRYHMEYVVSPEFSILDAAVEIWNDRTATPIFPLPIARNRVKLNKHRVSKRKPPATQVKKEPLILPEDLSEERLHSVLDNLRRETRAREKQREDLLRKIKQLQVKAHKRKEQAREVWRRRYIEAKKVTPRLEEECSRLRTELERLHRELLAKVQAGVWALLTISGKTEKPSNKLSYKIMVARRLQEIEDLSRRVEATRLKLHTEIKLKAMAEKDVRNLREELLKKKIQVTLTRNQEQATMGNGLREQYFISAV